MNQRRHCPPVVLLLPLLLSLAPSVARAGEPRSFSPKWAETVQTADGLRIALHRYPPAPGRDTGATLLLFPDVGLTHRAYDLEGRGLARYLQRRGVEVVVVDFRGSGLSDVPLGGYLLEDLLDGDAEGALAHLPAPRRLFVGGQGLGGTVALLLAARHPEKVRGVVSLQAAVTADIPSEPVAKLLGRPLSAAVPWIRLAELSRTPLFGARSWFEVMAANDGSLTVERAEVVRRKVLSTVPRGFVRQLAGFARQRRITVKGEDVGPLMARYRGPSLLFFAPRDNWIHPEFSTPLRDLLDRGGQQVEFLNRLEGAAFDYGHLGMLHGEGATSDVYAPIRAFIGKGSR